MAKIVLMMNNRILQEVPLSKARVTIGRGSHNDIVIDHRAISSEHAVIVTTQNDSFLEDLNSTNGTKINGQPVKKHFLQKGDVIELGQYTLKYMNAHSTDVRIQGSPAGASEKESGVLDKTVRLNVTAMIRVLNGPNAGKELVVNKTLTTLGRPEVEVAAILRRQQGYFLAYVEGSDYPLVNGEPIGAQTYRLSHGDVIDLSGTQMRFSIR